MKIIECIWFGKIGIIIVERDKIKQGYIGIGTGFDEKSDIKHILDWGQKLSLPFFERLVESMK